MRCWLLQNIHSVRLQSVLPISPDFQSSFSATDFYTTQRLSKNCFKKIYSEKKNAATFQKKAPLKIIAMYVKMYAAYSDQKGSDNVLPIYLAELDMQEDKDKFAELYEKYSRKMYNIALAILKNKEDAEDAVDITFHKLANNFTNISQKKCNEIEGYIVISVRNISIDIYRRNKNEMKKIVPLKENDSVDSFLDKKIERDDMREAIEKLSNRYQDMIYLCDFQQLSSKEAAELLNISEESVRARLHRARKKLKTILERRDNND